MPRCPVNLRFHHGFNPREVRCANSRSNHDSYAYFLTIASSCNLTVIMTFPPILSNLELRSLVSDEKAFLHALQSTKRRSRNYKQRSLTITERLPAIEAASTKSFRLLTGPSHPSYFPRSSWNVVHHVRRLSTLSRWIFIAGSRSRTFADLGGILR